MYKYRKNTPFRVKFRVWWNELWIRRDEFHESLSLDAEAQMYMEKDSRTQYVERLICRRQVAHNRDCLRSN